MSNNTIQAYAAMQAGEKLVPYQFDAGELQPHQVEVKVEYCGLCHSDISVLNNEWRSTVYPVVAGHEIIGRIVALGSEAKDYKLGNVSVLAGPPKVAKPVMSVLVVSKFFVRAKMSQQSSDMRVALPIKFVLAGNGPFPSRRFRPRKCWSPTLRRNYRFDPLLKHKIQATHHVGVIGIGGLGHIAIKLLKAWGCEITAFSSNPDKTEELKAMGADHVVNSRDTEAVKAQKGKFDLLLSTVNVTLNWRAFISTLAPNGSLHFLGLTLEPVPVSVGSLIDGAKSVTGSPTGSAALRQLLKFAARKNCASN